MISTENQDTRRNQIRAAVILSIVVLVTLAVVNIQSNGQNRLNRNAAVQTADVQGDDRCRNALKPITGRASCLGACIHWCGQRHNPNKLNCRDHCLHFDNDCKLPFELCKSNCQAHPALCSGSPPPPVTPQPTTPPKTKKPTPTPKTPRPTVTPPIDESCTSFPCGVMTQQMCKVAGKCEFHADRCRCKDTSTDFVFLIDTSRSLNVHELEQSKNLVDTILMNLPAQSRAGIITFGRIARHVVGLPSKKSMDAIRNDVRNIQLDAKGAWGTAMHGAMKIAFNQYFLGGNVAKTKNSLVIILTDGEPTGNNPCAYAKAIMDRRKLRVMIIGITNAFKQEPVRCLVSGKGEMVQAKGFSSADFAKVWPRIDAAICPSK